MKAFPLVLASSLLLLPSCESFTSEEYTPEYLKEPSPLDPPGTEAARKALRMERVKEGKYEEGSSLSLQQGRVFLLSRNPEYDLEPEGRLVEAEEAKILSCEGLYYFVELSDGKRGYLRETDFVDPELVPEETLIELDDNQTLTTNADGRAVILVGKKSDRAVEFERRRKAIETGEPLPEGDELPLPSSSLDAPPLPDPAGDGPQG